MQRLQSRTYVGTVNEVVTVTTQPDGGGQVAVSLEGRPLGTPRDTFRLPSQVGLQLTMQVALVGPLGAACVVGIAEVDGGSDGDLLLCQPHSPAPAHSYTFAAVTAGTVRNLAGIKSGRTEAAARATRGPKAKRSRKGRR